MVVEHSVGWPKPPSKIGDNYPNKLYLKTHLTEIRIPTQNRNTKSSKKSLRKDKTLPLELSMHQIVAALFLSPSLGKSVHHRNGISWDNRVHNLKYVTEIENFEYRKGTPVQVIEQGSNMMPFSISQ